MRQYGSVKFFNADKGFGFLIPQNGDKDVFVHISQVEGNRPLKENQKVEFDLVEGKRGIAAEKVKPC